MQFRGSPLRAQNYGELPDKVRQERGADENEEDEQDLRLLEEKAAEAHADRTVDIEERCLQHLMVQADHMCVWNHVCSHRTCWVDNCVNNQLHGRSNNCFKTKLPAINSYKYLCLHFETNLFGKPAFGSFYCKGLSFDCCRF